MSISILDEWVVFVGGGRGGSIVAIGDFYELYDVRWGWGYVWMAIGRDTKDSYDVWSNLGHACACDGEGVH